jgi:hypothetical protein
MSCARSPDSAFQRSQGAILVQNASPRPVPSHCTPTGPAGAYAGPRRRNLQSTQSSRCQGSVTVATSCSCCPNLGKEKLCSAFPTSGPEISSRSIDPLIVSGIRQSTSIVHAKHIHYLIASVGLGSTLEISGLSDFRSQYRRTKKPDFAFSIASDTCYHTPRHVETLDRVACRTRMHLVPNWIRH